MIARMKFFFREFIIPNWRWMALVFASGLIASATSGLGIPMLVKFVFPVVFHGEGDELPELLQYVPSLQTLEPGTLLLMACASIPLMFFLRGFFLWGNAVAVNYVGLRILEALRMMVFNRVQQLPIAFLEHRQKGDIISRVTADTANVQTTLTSVSNDLVKQPVTTLCALVAFIALLVSTGHGLLFFLNLLFIGLAVGPIMVFGKRISQRSKKAQDGLGELNSLLQQNLETQREVRAYGLEQRQTDDFRSASETYCRNFLKVVKYQKALVPVMETVTSLALAVLLVQGYRYGMDLTTFMAMAAALFFLFDSMKRAGQAFNRLNEAQGPLERLYEVLREPDTMPDPVQPVEFAQPVRGDLRFRNVSFSYNEGGAKVLRDIDVHIPAGQVVGLVGPSGAGKTTFASLIPRFYDVTTGSVELDGVNVKAVTKRHLREQMALVGQQALLFAGTIKENILLGREGASDEDIQAAADSASVSAFIKTQPQGMNTKLGDGGSGLSGGQRQRVAIARAFIKDAPVLILDEATASLDAESERAIQEQLDYLSRGRTTLIVAHRFSTIRHADRILVFDAGRIVGDGTHEQLYATCPLYRELYDRQGV